MSLKKTQSLQPVILFLNIILAIAIFSWLSFILYKTLFQSIRTIKSLIPEINKLSSIQLNDEQIKKVINFEKTRKNLQLDLSNIEDHFK